MPRRKVIPTMEEMEREEAQKRERENICSSCTRIREYHHEVLTRDGELILICPTATFG